MPPHSERATRGHGQPSLNALLGGLGGRDDSGEPAGSQRAQALAQAKRTITDLLRAVGPDHQEAIAEALVYAGSYRLAQLRGRRAAAELMYSTADFLATEGLG